MERIVTAGGATDPLTLRLRFPKLVLFGRGTIQQLGGELKRLGAGRALVVTDPGVRRAGLVEPVQRVLSAAGFSVGVFDAVEPEPLTDGVRRAADLAREEAFDAIVGVGGGSSLDTAKAVSALAVPGRRLEDMYGAERVPGPGLVKALIPTTAGTGSEMSAACIFRDPAASGVKRTLSSGFLTADVAVVDPDLTRDLPPKITAESGLDAVTHAIEAFTTRRTNDLADLWARHALTLAARSLRTAYTRGPEAPEAREDMALAAMIANAAATMAGLGAVHGLAHPLSTKAKIGHGRANALLLPVVMEFNCASRPDRFAEIARVFGYEAGDPPGEGAVAAIRALRADLGIDDSLAAYGVTAGDLGELAGLAFTHYAHHLNANPRPLTQDDAIEIYQRAL